jgi:hypothetical protein
MLSTAMTTFHRTTSPLTSQCSQTRRLPLDYDARLSRRRNLSLARVDDDLTRPQRDMSDSTIHSLWQQFSHGNFHEAIQFLSKQPLSTANDMVEGLLLYSEAHLLHQHHLTADIWLRLVEEKIVQIKRLDSKLVQRMKHYVHTAQSVRNMHQYILGRWQEGWWERLKYERVSHRGGLLSRMPVLMPVLMPLHAGT